MVGGGGWFRKEKRVEAEFQIEDVVQKFKLMRCSGKWWWLVGSERKGVWKQTFKLKTDAKVQTEEEKRQWRWWLVPRERAWKLKLKLKLKTSGEFKSWGRS
jgi:hypothetical protein